MVVYTIECSRCGTTRIGRRREGDDGIQPYHNSCPECGGTAYSVPAGE